VEVRWKDGKDLTNGETQRAWGGFLDKKEIAEGRAKGKEKAKPNGEAAAPAATSTNGKKRKLSAEERMGGGQPSLFTWFAWKGKGTDVEEVVQQGIEEVEEDDVFNHGDELATIIADDIYPNAIKYFLETVTGDGESDIDSELEVSDDDEDEDNIIEIPPEEEIGVGGSAGVKRHDITPPGSDDDEDDESENRRKRVKK